MDSNFQYCSCSLQKDNTINTLLPLCADVNSLSSTHIFHGERFVYLILNRLEPMTQIDNN